MPDFDGVCDSFVDRVCRIQGFENKFRYQLDQFFFKEGWASKTNPNAQKEGYSAQLTYNESNIRHFIEDMARFTIAEFKDAQPIVESEIEFIESVLAAIKTGSYDFPKRMENRLKKLKELRGRF